MSRYLITYVACWISAKFAFKVNEIVSEYFLKDFKERCEANEIKIVDLETKIQKYEYVKEDISPKIRNLGKWHIFTVLMTGDIVYPYYGIRCQRRSKNTLVKKLRQKYPNITEIFEINYDPNSINLFNRIKEEIGNITTFGNRIKLLNGYAIQEFENDVRLIAEEKDID